MPTTPYLTIDQSKTILSLLKDLEVKLAAIVQAAIPAPQSDPPSHTQQPNSLAKRKRNQRTRKQHKRKKAQAQRVTIQEVEQSYGQEVDSARISVEKVASKHEVLIKSMTWNGIPTVATSWHAVISCVGMTSFDGMIMIRTNGVRRMGVG